MEKITTSDSDIIRQVLGGDRNSYALLMQKYNRRLYRVCRGYLKDEAEIEDVMQDAYVRAFENLGTFEHRSAFSTWLTRILINECLQRLRREARKTEIFYQYQSDVTMNQSETSDPESGSLRRELQNLIENKVELLPENYRVVFLMREVEKMNVAETAEVLMISESNVKVRLNRAKEMLRKALLEVYPIEELYDFHLTRCARIASAVMARIAALSGTLA